jgi:hypothetical protein
VRQHPPAMKQLVVGMRVDGEDCGTIGHGVSVATGAGPGCRVPEASASD